MFGKFKQRSLKPERLDTGDYTPEEYSKWQQEIRVIHRVFGEMRALRRAMLSELRASESKCVSILDVGAGSGELLKAVKKWAPGKDTFLVGAELSGEAAVSIKENGVGGGIHAIQCDALKLPFGDDSFDYIFSTLFLHHLTDEQAVQLLNEIGRVARKRFFVIDLHRSAIAYYFYKIIGAVLLQRFTREDGALSILKSFRPRELSALAVRSGLKDVKVKRSAAYRLVLSGRKREVQA